MPDSYILSLQPRATSHNRIQVNKTLGLLGDRCPSSCNDLVSARAGLKHYLGRACSYEHGRTKSCKKWSKVKPVAERLLNICLGAWDSHSKILCDDKRWACSTATPGDFLNEAELAKAMLKLHPQTKKSVKHIWAACYNMIHTKHLEAEAQGGVSASLHTFALIFGLKRSSSHKTDLSAFVPVEKLAFLNCETVKMEIDVNAVRCEMVCVCLRYHVLCFRQMLHVNHINITVIEYH